MKITKTQRIERRIVDLYKRTKNKEETELQEKMELLVLCFQMINIFTNEDHLAVVNKLYFCRDNILRIGVRGMSRKVYIPERSLCERREKYCELIENIFGWNDPD